MHASMHSFVCLFVHTGSDLPVDTNVGTGAGAGAGASAGIRIPTSAACPPL